MHLYLNVMTNGPIISDFIEKLVAVSHTVKDGNITSTTLSNLETVAGVVNSLLEQGGRSNEDLYLIIGHPHGSRSNEDL